MPSSSRPRRLVFLCDVSGSMEPYARALVRFLHTVVIARGRVEAFAMGTRLTRITRELSSRDPDVALAAAARSVVDWSGGTRLGEGLLPETDTVFQDGDLLHMLSYEDDLDRVTEVLKAAPSVH